MAGKAAAKDLAPAYSRLSRNEPAIRRVKVSEQDRVVGEPHFKGADEDGKIVIVIAAHLATAFDDLLQSRALPGSRVRALHHVVNRLIGPGGTPRAGSRTLGCSVEEMGGGKQVVAELHHVDLDVDVVLEDMAESGPIDGLEGGLVPAIFPTQFGAEGGSGSGVADGFLMSASDDLAMELEHHMRAREGAGRRMRATFYRELMAVVSGKAIGKYIHLFRLGQGIKVVGAV